MKIYLLCPVRKATNTIKILLDAYTEMLEKDGHEVFYPARDNPFENIDLIGTDICRSNVDAIKNADEVHIYWISSSTGSKFDLGIVWAYEKPIILLNEFEVNKAPSFGTLLLGWPFGIRKEFIQAAKKKLSKKVLEYSDTLTKEQKEFIGQILTKYWSKR